MPRDSRCDVPTWSSDRSVRRDRFVVKHPGTGDYFEIGEQEHFLLTSLDAATDRGTLSTKFESRFGEPLAGDDFDDFVDLAREQGLLVEETSETANERQAEQKSDAVPARRRQSILYWRKNLFDPDRLFTRLEPRIRFVWTPGFVALSALSILAAVWLVWIGRQDLAQSFRSSLRWESAVLAWFTLLVVVALHEGAHGLTCKHFGGEVREIGFLLMFFMPCFYCNVSDAWLFPEKSRRQWVTFAGGYFELFLWSLSVFVWRLTIPGSLVNYLAFIVLSLCGIQSLFNFLPLIKLDGYYMLSDWAEVPNLRQRGLDRWMTHLRRMLWGGPPVAPEPKGRFLTLFGLASWSFSLVFVCVMLVGACHWLGEHVGVAGVACAVVVGMISVRQLLRGSAGGEVSNMLRMRRWRTMLWLGALAWCGTALCVWEIEDRAGGTFELRSTVRSEIRTPVAGFLREVYVSEGQRLSPGTPILRLEIPELSSQLAQKQAELSEAEAELCLLQAGTRVEELRAQQRRVKSARAWRDTAERNLECAREALQDQLAALDGDVVWTLAEWDTARHELTRVESLHAQQAASSSVFEAAQLRVRAARAAYDKATAEKQTVASRGVVLMELQLAEREHELATLEAALEVLEAEARPEEVRVHQTRIQRLGEELHELQQRQESLVVSSPVGGLVTTPRFRERIGSFFQTGDLILLVEDPSSMEAAVQLNEQSVRRVRDGQSVTLRLRSVPLQTVTARVECIADAAEPDESLSHVRVDCVLDDPSGALRPACPDTRESTPVGGPSVRS